MGNYDKCKKCKYRAAPCQQWTCEYITIVGHSRGCEPGNKCTVYEKGDRILFSNSPAFYRTGEFLKKVQGRKLRGE